MTTKHDLLMNAAVNADITALNSAATIEAARRNRAWRYDEQRAMRQGWLLAESERGLEIQRYDAANHFDSDDEALRYVHALALNGDLNAGRALETLSERKTPRLTDPLYMEVRRAGFVYHRTEDDGAMVTHFYLHGDRRVVTHPYGYGWALITPDGLERSGRKMKDLITALKTTKEAK